MRDYRRAEVEELIESKLHLLRVRDERERIVTGILAFLGILSGVIVTTILAEGIFYLSAQIRTLIVNAVVVISILTFILFILYPFGVHIGILPRKGDRTLAKLTGDRFPGIKDRLLNLLQIAEERRKKDQYYSAELIDASYEDLADEVKKNDFSAIVEYTLPGKIVKGLGYGLVFLLILFLISPEKLIDAGYRVYHYDQEFAPPVIFTLSIKPGDIEVVRGDSVTIDITVEGERQPDVKLYTRRKGGVSFEENILTSEDGRSFNYTVQQIRTGIEYYAGREGRKTKRYTISVIDPPYVRDMNIRLNYPEYTGIEPVTLAEHTGNITALKGSVAELAIVANKDLAKALIDFKNREDAEMAVAGNKATAGFQIISDDRYAIRLTDTSEIGNIEPVEYTIRVVNDRYPAVEIVVPGSDVVVGEDLRLPVIFRIRDDFGFTGLLLKYRLVQSRYELPQEEYQSIEISLPGEITGVADTALTEAVVEYLWNLRDMRLAPEDIITYHAVVYDNDRISGPKKGRSESYLIRLPSLDEVFAEIDRHQVRSLEELEYSAEEAEKLRRDLEEIRRELQLAQHELDWNKKRRLEEILDRYEELQERLEDTGRRLEQMITEMERHQVLSHETLEKYLELQQMYQQLTDPDFRKTMEELRKAMEQMDPRVMQDAMRNLDIDEEQLRQALERTISLLKRIHIEQKVDELLKRIEQMVEEQKEVGENLDGDDITESGKSEDVESRMEDLLDKLDRFMEELSALQSMMEEFPVDMPLEELQNIMDQLDEANFKDLVEQMLGGLHEGNLEVTRSEHEQISGSIEQIQESLAGMQQAMLQDQIRAILNELRRSLRNLNMLSMRQEDVLNETGNLESNSPLFVGRGREQREIVRNLNRVVEDLVALSGKTFAITPAVGKALGEAFRSMEEVIEHLISRDRGRAVRGQGNSMTALNEATLLLQQSLDMMMEAGGAGGMQALLQQLQEMTGQQQQINIETNQLGEGEMSMEQMAEMQRLAAGQEAVRRSLEELSEEMSGREEQGRILGDLGLIEREMNEVIKDLRAAEIHPETLSRQEEILSRLLDAARSIRERDYDERRIPRPGEEIVRESPPEFDIRTEEGRVILREELMRAVREGYVQDYEELIRRYFELLREMD